MKFKFELTLRLEVEADDEAAAFEKAKEAAANIGSTMTEPFYETLTPTLYEDASEPEITEFSGFHRFRADDGSEYGSFEVHQITEPVPTAEEPIEPGWYWRSCFPGCLPDGDDMGPFPTAEGAYLDAMEGF